MIYQSVSASIVNRRNNYAVFLFDQEQPYDYPEHPNLHEGEYTCIPKLRQLCDFMGLR